MWLKSSLRSGLKEVGQILPLTPQRGPFLMLCMPGPPLPLASPSGPEAACPWMRCLSHSSDGTVSFQEYLTAP